MNRGTNTVEYKAVFCNINSNVISQYVNCNLEYTSNEECTILLNYPLFNTYILNK